MKNFFGRIGNGFRNFMIGRYGSDDLGRFLMGILLILIVASFIFRNPILQGVIWVLFLYIYFRMLSRNYAKRAAENDSRAAVRISAYRRVRGT